MNYKTRLTIFHLVKDLEKAKGRSLRQDELAELIGLDARTVKVLMDGTSKRVDFPTIDKLLSFFAAEGMPITPNDIFIVQNDAQ